MNRQVVGEGIFTNRWDRISGTVQHIEGDGSRVVISPRKRRATITVELDGYAEVSLDGCRVEPAAIQPGHHLAAIGSYTGQVFRACSVRLYSDLRRSREVTQVRSPEVTHQLRPVPSPVWRFMMVLAHPCPWASRGTSAHRDENNHIAGARLRRG